MSYKTTGWNDCPPILDIGSLKSKKSRNSSKTLVNFDDEPTSQPGSDKTEDEVMANFDNLASLRTSLSQKEYTYYVKKLRGNLPTALKNNHYRELINDILINILNKNSAVESKNQLINFTLANPGVVGWALPLRKIVDNVILE